MKLFNDYKPPNYLHFAEFIFFLIFSIFLCAIPVYASTNLTIFPPNSTPFGKPYSEWTANWWNWYIETPFDSNHPSKDPTGASCNRNQYGPVWFLSGSEKSPIEKTCVIPSGKAILFPILNYECSYAEDKTLKTPADLLKCAKSGTDVFQFLQFKYDGKDVPLDQIKEFRVATSPFTINFPTSNVFRGTPGPTSAVSDGYWIMFEPPSAGNYDIKFRGCGGGAIPTAAPAATSAAGFCQDVTYHLKVLPS